jgi:signal transduction histidine kinase
MDNVQEQIFRISNPINVLLIDDDEDDYLITERLLSLTADARFSLEWTDTFEGAMEALKRGEHDVYLVDYRLGERDGLDVLAAANEMGSNVPVILLTGQGDHQVDVRAMETGAADYLVKGEITPPLLERSIRYAIARKQAELEVLRLNENLEQRVEQRTAELEAANKELEAFAHSVSHDLRAPLRSIDGFARIIQEDYAQSLPNEVLHYLEILRANTRKMAQLIDDMLAFSKMTRQSLVKQSAEPAKLVEQCLQELAPEFTDRRIDISVDELPVCRAHSSLLKQVFFNMLSNALKYTRQREVAVIEVGCQTANDENIYFVRDNGEGFNMQYADKVFSMFQRLHSADEYEGSGIGMALAQNIIERHGGRVWVESEPDVGTTFYFMIDGGHDDVR